MTSLPELRESRIVRSGRGEGPVISCGLPDLMLANLTTSVVFCYEQALDDARLADSLASALDVVPAFAGRLRQGDGTLDIVCDNAGVPMTTVDATDSLAEVIGRLALPRSGLVDHVDAPAARGGGLPLLTVQLSRLPDGCTVIGCSWHHAVGDLRSFMILMRAWSAAAEGRPLPGAVMPDDRAAYLDQVLPPSSGGRSGIRLMASEEAERFERDIAAALMTGRTLQIYFGDAEAGRLRDEFCAAAGQRLSISEVLCSHVVSTIGQFDADPVAARSLALAVDIRPHLGLPLAVIGNLTSEAFLTYPAQTAAHELAALISAELADFTGSHLSLRASLAFLESIGRSRVGECVPIGFDLARRTFTFNNWRDFGVYDVTFGGRRPVYFSPAAGIRLPWTSWLVEGASGAGHLFTVSVPARLAAKLRGQGGREALHRTRAPGDEMPGLAQSRKLL